MNSTPSDKTPARHGRGWLRNLLATGVATAAMTAATLTPTPAMADPHADMAENYTSLSASLIGFYATKSNQSVSQYLDSQQVLLKPADLTFPTLEDPAAPSAGPSLGPSASADPSGPPALGPSTTPGATATADGEPFAEIDVAQASAGGGLLLTADQLGYLTGSATPVQANSVKTLNAQLAASGVTLSSKSFNSLTSLAKQVTKSARTPDGAVTLASAQWATQLSQLRAPELKAPGTPAAGRPGVPADALPLGLLMNQSLTNMVLNSPDLIKQAQASHGLGSPGLVKAWNTSMAQAYAQSSGSLTALLPNPCVGEMMGVMATGSAAKVSGNCSNACVVAGQYLHHQSGAAFDANQNSFSSNVNNPAGGILNHATFSNMASWAQGLVGAQNPKLTGPSSISRPGAGASDCAAAASGAKNTLGVKLPGMFSNLR